MSPKYSLEIDGYAFPTNTFPATSGGKYIQANVGDTNYEWQDVPLQMQETISVDSDGQTVFDLTETPLSEVLMFINGLKQDLNTEFLVNNQVITYTGELTLLTTDVIEFWYVYVETPAQIDDLELWWEADFTEDQGVETETSSPEVFTTIPNRGRYGGTFGSTGTARPTVANIEAGGRVRATALFDDTDDYHDSSLAAAAWVQAHQEWTWVVVCRPSDNGYLISTCANDPTEIGFLLNAQPSTTDLDFNLGDGTGAWNVDISTPAASLPINEMSIIVLSYSQVAGYDMRMNGVSVASGALGGAPDPGTPQATLRIGSAVAGGEYGGQIPLILGYSRVLTDDEITRLENHCANKYQNQAVPLDYAPTFWFRGDLGVERQYSETGVAIWRDLSGNAHDASQTSTDNQLTHILPDTDFDNTASLEGDGTSDSMGLSAGAGWPAGTDHSLLAVIDQDDAAGTADYLLDFQTGRIVFELLSASFAGRVGIFEGAAARNIGDAVAGPQALEWHCDDTGNAVEVYRAGVFVGTAAYNSAIAPGGDTSLFSRNTRPFVSSTARPPNSGTAIHY